MQNAFSTSHFVLGYGRELIQRGWDPNGLLVTVEPKANLEALTVEQGLDVFVPVMNSSKGALFDNETAEIDNIIMPFDFEIYVNDYFKLYNPTAQKYYFNRDVIPVASFLLDFFNSFGIPHILDWTPSGGHILTKVVKGTSSWNNLKNTGYVNNRTFGAYNYLDYSDLKRNPAVGIEAASVFHGLCFIAEYIGIETLKKFGSTNRVTFWDNQQKSGLSIDISWTACSGFMRIIRSPFSAHKKISQRYGISNDILIDVMGRYFDGSNDVYHEHLGFNIEKIIDLMWDFESAVDYSYNFTGYIPEVTYQFDRLIQDFLNADLHELYNFCYTKPDIDIDYLIRHVKTDPRLNWKTVNMLEYPHSRMLDPNAVKKFIGDLIFNDYHPGNIMDIIDYCYNLPFDWGRDNLKDPPVIKAEAFVRHFTAVNLIEKNIPFIEYIRNHKARL
jgi:hypothetical protein